MGFGKGKGKAMSFMEMVPPDYPSLPSPSVVQADLEIPPPPPAQQSWSPYDGHKPQHPHIIVVNSAPPPDSPPPAYDDFKYREAIIPAPVDKGTGAWSFLAAAYVVDAAVWGFPFCSGVFLSALLGDTKYTQKFGAWWILPFIGPISSILLYVLCIICYPLMRRYPRYRRKAIFVGAAVTLGSVLFSGFVKNAIGLLFIQGIVYPVGAAILYAPCVTFVPEWFVKRRGLANGVLFTGAALGGIIFPLIASGLTKSLKPSVSLHIMSLIMIAFIGPALPFLKPRPSITGVVGQAAVGCGKTPRKKAWIKNKMMWPVIAMNVVQGLAHFLPKSWLPSIATDNTMSAGKSPAVFAVLNIAVCVGSTALGFLSDRMSPWPLAIATVVFLSLAMFILWGVLSSALATLVTFGIVFGCLAGGWSAVWAWLVRVVVKDDFLGTSLFSYLLFTRGIGNIMSTPTTSIIRAHRMGGGGELKEAVFGLDTSGGAGMFGSMIVYAVSSITGAAVIAIVSWIVESGW